LAVDKDNIATFVEVVRRSSLAAAARHLGVPKSTVSRRLARLEAQTGVRLVHRDARRVRTTTEGARFYESVVNPVDALDTAVAALEENTTEPKGTIRVTAPGDLARLLLVPVLSRFLEEYPEIALELVLTNRFVDLVQEGVDLAVRAGEVTEPGSIVRKLCRSDLKLAASPRLEVAVTDVREVAEIPFVLFRGHGRSQVLRLSRGGDGPPEIVEVTVRGRIQVDDYAAMSELVAAGQGLGLLPEIHLVEGVRSGRLVSVFSEWRVPAPAIQIVYSTRELPERVRLLVQYLMKSV